MKRTTKKVQAIETEYGGYKFRSRLEARWAVFFDTIDIEWEYEPEGYELPSGKRYLPDFKVKCYGTRGYCGEKPFELFVEVKGEMSEGDHERIREFSGFDLEGDRVGDTHKVLIVGTIPKVICEDDTSDSDIFDCYTEDGFFNYETIDGDFFGAFPSVKGGKFFLMGDECQQTGGDLELLVKGYKAARQARFEHGETPISKHSKKEELKQWEEVEEDVRNDSEFANATIYYSKVYHRAIILDPFFTREEQNKIQEEINENIIDVFVKHNPKNKWIKIGARTFKLVLGNSKEDVLIESDVFCFARAIYHFYRYGMLF